MVSVNTAVMTAASILLLRRAKMPDIALLALGALVAGAAVLVIAFIIIHRGDDDSE
jgi:hypothetical protein